MTPKAQARARMAELEVLLINHYHKNYISKTTFADWLDDRAWDGSNFLFLHSEAKELIELYEGL